MNACSNKNVSQSNELAIMRSTLKHTQALIFQISGIKQDTSRAN